MATATAVLSRTSGPKTAASAAASATKTAPNTCWPRLISRAAVSRCSGEFTVFSLPQLVDAVVAAGRNVDTRVGAELRLAERRADLVRSRVVAAPVDDPLDVAGRRVLQRGQPLVVAALIDQLAGRELEGDAFVAERLHEHPAAGVMGLQERDNWILPEHRR